MKENTHFFPHDFHARHDPKLIKLSVYGLELKSIYWDITEMLHEQGGFLDTDSKPIAFEIRCEEAKVDFVVNFKGLFDIKDGKFTCQRVLNNIKYIKEKSEKGRISANKRWHGNTTALQSDSE